MGEKRFYRTHLSVTRVNGCRQRSITNANSMKMRTNAPWTSSIRRAVGCARHRLRGGETDAMDEWMDGERRGRTRVIARARRGGGGGGGGGGGRAELKNHSQIAEALLRLKAASRGVVAREDARRRARGGGGSRGDGKSREEGDARAPERFLVLPRRRHRASPLSKEPDVVVVVLARRGRVRRRRVVASAAVAVASAPGGVLASRSTRAHREYVSPFPSPPPLEVRSRARPFSWLYTCTVR